MKDQPISPATEKRSKKPVYFVVAMILIITAGAYLLIFSGRKHTTEPTSAPSGKPMEQFRNDGTLKITTAAGVVKQELAIEIVDRDETRMQGMMGRTSMAQNHAMLFIFDEDEERSFWMANTPLPLDIIFITKDFEIIKIHSRTTPYSEESYPSGKAARYVLETNGGYCERYGIHEGDKIIFTRKSN